MASKESIMAQMRGGHSHLHKGYDLDDIYAEVKDDPILWEFAKKIDASYNEQPNGVLYPVKYQAGNETVLARLKNKQTESA